MTVFVDAHASPTVPRIHSDINLERDISVYVELENQMRQRPKEDALHCFQMELKKLLWEHCSLGRITREWKMHLI